MIRIIGIGSPFGDDVAGLEAARRLERRRLPGTHVFTADRPGASLVEMMASAESAILIDAVRSGAPAGTLHDLDLGEIEGSSLRFLSSHGLGVAEALALARALGRAPQRGRLLGIEAGKDDPRQLRQLDGDVAAAIEAAVERACEWVRRFRTDGGAGGRNVVRKRLAVSGVVQGIGFRPFVWRLAQELALAGFVCNAGGSVLLEVEGESRTVDLFVRRLQDEAPAGASLEAIAAEERPLCHAVGFVIRPSARGRAATPIPPDLAMCADCRAEIFAPANRRFRYPLTNCTQCGPRFTVVQGLPYDRSATTLRSFPLCSECEREYRDPASRRFHAEPITCARCGPRVWLERAGAIDALVQGAGESDAVAAAARVIGAGGVIALLGIGGAHLACDAGNEGAVGRIRAMKHRPHKPFAVMVESLEAAARLAQLSDSDRRCLSSPAAPIVLVPARPGNGLAGAVAPGVDRVGLVLAYSPLHALLLSDCDRPLVMTSANLPGEPLAFSAAEVRRTFGAAVDALLLHERPIHQRCDDGVVLATARGTLPIRRSRGNTPRALSLPLDSPLPLLGVGGDLKNSFCFVSGGQAFLSQYIGAMEHVATQEHFRDTLERWRCLTGIEPAAVAHDLHPGYASRPLAEKLGRLMIGVQHHHAHVASCLAEHGRMGPVIGFAFDGTGYGADGSIWGGEVLIANACDFERFAHLQYLPLPGGDAAVRRPARTAGAYLLSLLGRIPDGVLEDRLSPLERNFLQHATAARGLAVPTSSCGRLFDAVAAILGVAKQVTYEGQAAIELEAVARRATAGVEPYPFTIAGSAVQLGPMLAALVEDARAGRSPSTSARRFHRTLAAIAVDLAKRARDATSLSTVALSGGCFQNQILLEDSVALLGAEGFEVLLHREVPANDGGLALGQAFVAAARLGADRRKATRASSPADAARG